MNTTKPSPPTNLNRRATWALLACAIALPHALPPRQAHAQAAPDTPPQTATTAPQPPAPTDAPHRSRRNAVVDVFERTRDAVVNIATTREVMLAPYDEIFFYFLDRYRPPTQLIRSLGSGVIIHGHGYVITNHHVVETADEITVTMADKSQYHADVIASDAAHDLALLRIRRDDKRPLPFIHLGTSSDLMVGEDVIAVGNPHGYEHTVTRGIISALHRKLEFSDKRGRHVEFAELIQTDAAINPGNSGGPLLNINGDLIGINTAIRGDAQNIGFAIPVDQVKQAIPTLLDYEKAREFVLGIDVEHINISNGSPQGVRVKQVRPHSPADESGIHIGDRLVALDHQPIIDFVDFYARMNEKHAGQRAALRIQRSRSAAKTENLDLTLALAPQPMPDAAKILKRRFGVTVRELNPNLARQLQLPWGRGLLVVAIDTDSPAEGRLQLKDIIDRVGNYRIPNLNFLGQLMQNVDSGDRADFGLVREQPDGLYRIYVTLYAR